MSLSTSCAPWLQKLKSCMGAQRELRPKCPKLGEWADDDLTLRLGSLGCGNEARDHGTARADIWDCTASMMKIPLCME